MKDCDGVVSWFLCNRKKENACFFLLFSKSIGGIDHIKQVFGLPSKPWSNGQVERLNRTLKRALIIGMQIQGNNNWVKILPQFVQNYNDSVHSVTGKTPNELDEEEDKEILNEVQKRFPIVLSQEMRMTNLDLE